jgi:hypothetical protein
MSLWLVTIVVVLVGLILVAAALSVAFLADLNRHRKIRLTQSHERGDTEPS